MARQSTINKEEVFAAVSALVAAGDYPNPSNVRRCLDGRGSPPLVQRYIGQWYAEFGPELARKADAKPPKKPTDGLETELKRLTEQAVQEVEEAQKERIKALEDRAAALDGREASLMQREAHQEAREAAHTELLADLRAQLAAANRQLDAAHARSIEEAGVVRAQIETLQTVLAARESELTLLRPLAQQLPALQAALERAQADANREQARVVDLVGERDRLHRLDSDRAVELAKVKGQLDRADEAATAQTAFLAETRRQLQDATTKLAGQQVRIEAQARELEQAEAGRRGDKEQIEVLRSALAEAAQEQAVMVARLKSEQASRVSDEGLLAELATLRDGVRRIDEQVQTFVAGKATK